MHCWEVRTSALMLGKQLRASHTTAFTHRSRRSPTRLLFSLSLSLSLSFPFSPLPFFPAKSLSRHYSPRHYHRLFGRLRSSIRIMPTLLPLFTTYETSRKRRSRGLSSPSILAALYCAAQCLLWSRSLPGISRFSPASPRLNCQTVASKVDRFTPWVRSGHPFLRFHRQIFCFHGMQLRNACFTERTVVLWPPFRDVTVSHVESASIMKAGQLMVNFIDIGVATVLCSKFEQKIERSRVIDTRIYIVFVFYTFVSFFLFSFACTYVSK